MDIIFLTSDLIEAARGLKHPSEAKMYWEKFLSKFINNF